ncbi:MULTISPECIES: hypothetical protein [Roseivirga]|jgi:hypothetical protein|nr:MULTISPECIES: hypothetical protein [Roseivirga]MEC7754070.1 hypothetical protein [Bacteroidota bacterium]|tara:strand:+ start:7620 stop:7766 length:147 start_codon:yes stop_codon:yes gene_type:complete
MKNPTKYPIKQGLSQNMNISGIQINGMKVLFEEKVSLMPIKTVNISHK